MALISVFTQAFCLFSYAVAQIISVCSLDRSLPLNRAYFKALGITAIFVLEGIRIELRSCESSEHINEMRKVMGHTAVSAIQASSVTLTIWQHGAKENVTVTL